MDCGTAAPERQFPLWMPRSLIAGSHKVRSLTRKALKSAAVGLTRVTGIPYIVEGGVVRNQFLIRLQNKRNSPVTFRIERYCFSAKICRWYRSESPASRRISPSWSHTYAASSCPARPAMPGR